MNVEWIFYKGKKILYIDYRDLTEEEMIEQLEYACKIILESKSPVLYLGNFIGVDVSSEFMIKANEWGKLYEPKTFKAAILGVTGNKRLLISTYKLITDANMKGFDSIEDAKEYLIR
jgi:hypothetical protein